MQTFDLGDEARSYVQNIMSHGWSLSTALVRIISNVKGSYFTCLPSDITKEDKSDFKHGFLFRDSCLTLDGGRLVPNHGDETEEPWNLTLVFNIRKELCVNDRYILFVEDFLASPGDGSLRHGEYSWITCDEKIFHVFKAKDIEAPTFTDLLRKTRSQPLWLGALGEPKKKIPDRRSGQCIGFVQKDYFTDFAETVGFVFIVAYDGQGFIFWKRD